MLSAPQEGQAELPVERCSLLPDGTVDYGVEPSQQNAMGYAQLYVLDPEEGLSARLQRFLAGAVRC